MNSLSKNHMRTGLLLVCLIGVVVLALFALRSDPPDDQGNLSANTGEPIAAQVNASPIYERDVELWLQGHDRELTDRDRQSAIQALIERRLLSGKAIASGLDQTPQVASEIRQAREQILANAFIAQHIQQSVTDEAIRALYDAQADLRRGGLERRARQILVPDRETADEVVDKLGRGDSFQSLAFAYSLDRASRETGGDMGYFSRDSFPAEFSSPVFAAAIGSRTEPFETERGWHIVEILDQRQAPNPDFSEIQENLREFLTAREVKNLIDRLTSDANISFPETNRNLNPSAKEANTDG